MLSNYVGFNKISVDKELFELPVGWWDKNMEDVATVSLVESGNIVVGGKCEVSKGEFLRGLLYNVVSLYSKDEVKVTLVSLNKDMCDDFNVLSNVNIINTEKEVDLGVNELLSDIEKRLYLLDKYGLSLNEYNKVSPIKMPYRLVVLDNINDFKGYNYLSILYDELKGDCRKRGTVFDRLYVLDCLNNADRCGVYFVTLVDDCSYYYLKSAKMNSIGMQNLIEGVKIGFNWSVDGFSSTYNLVGKGVLFNKGEEPYNFYSSTIARVDLINKLILLK